MNIFTQKTIYLDHAAATPVERAVVRAMMPYYTNTYANPGGLHAAALNARQAVEQARAAIARSLSARPQEIIFTASGTESNNLAILGVIHAFKQQHPDRIPHVLVSAFEHKAVLAVVQKLADEKAIELSLIPVTSEGIIDSKACKQLLRPETVLVSVMYANNEIGTIQPVEEIAKMIRHFRKHVTHSQYPLLHTDAIQAFQYYPLHTPRLGVDLLTLSAAKIYGPKGVAALFVKTGVTLDPIIVGGGQEFGLRSGTENVPLIVGFAKAVAIADALRAQETERLHKLHDYFIAQLSTFDRVRINGSLTHRLPHTINVTFHGISGERIVIELDARGIYVSAQSACTSHDETSSYVIKALYPDADTEDGGVRFSMGRTTQRSDIDYVIKNLRTIIDRITAANTALKL